jgi:hypothetical protein
MTVADSLEEIMEEIGAGAYEHVDIVAPNQIRDYLSHARGYHCPGQTEEDNGLLVL